MTSAVYVGGRPCKHGHTEGRYRKNRECVTCNRLRRQKNRDWRAETEKRNKTWRYLNIGIDHITMAQVEKMAKANRTSLVSFIREAVEWRLEELGE